MNRMIYTPDGVLFRKTLNIVKN